LITNGGFENSLTSWTTFSDDIGEHLWDIQHGTSFYSDIDDLPVPPEGQYAAMTASDNGFARIGISQDFNFGEFSQCLFVKFEVSFKYFYRNDAPNFIPGKIFGPPGTAQVFRVDILNTFNVGLHNLFITDSQSPQNTGGKYKKYHGSFYMTNAINAIQYDTLRLRFGERANIARLRVGIDDIHVTASCVDFPHEEHHEEGGHLGHKDEPKPQKNDDDDRKK